MPPKKDDGEEMLTAQQVCKTLDISRATLYNWINKGKLTPVRLNPNLEKGPVRFKGSEVAALNKAQFINSD